MKKPLLLLLVFVLLLLIQAKAQITLTQSSYPAILTGTDSLIKTTYNSPLPTLTATADGSWDLSTVTDSIPAFFNYRVPAITPYQFADSNSYSFSSYAYKGNVQSAITSSAILQYGIDIRHEDYNIGTSVTDSIFIPDQTTIYTSPRIKISLPAIFNSNWMSSYHSDFNYEISYSGILFHEPGIVRTYYTENNTIVGWGKMRIKNADGSPSEYINVLQIRTTTENTDSFYLSGSSSGTTLALLLSSFGVTQGQQTISYVMRFYREGEVTPLAEINFKDAAFTLPAGCTYHRQRLPRPQPNVVKLAEYEPSIAIYPNPIAGDYLHLALACGTGNWAYELISMDGRTIAKADLKTDNNNAQIKLPPTAVQGIYSLKLYNNGIQAAVRQITIDR